jgi:hypothetical protein
MPGIVGWGGEKKENEDDGWKMENGEKVSRLIAILHLPFSIFVFNYAA